MSTGITKITNDFYFSSQQILNQNLRQNIFINYKFGVVLYVFSNEDNNKSIYEACSLKDTFQK